LRNTSLSRSNALLPVPEQTLAVYDDFVRQGKLRYVALSNYPAWQVTEALWIADIRSLPPPA
jgi:1-deoxyxylulose-5-phosphate synthase